MARKNQQHDVIRWLGWARLGIGATFFLMPRRALRTWTGDEDGVGSRVVARALGAREVALGVGTLVALRRRAHVRGWIEAGVVCDASDALITLLGGGGLPPVRRLLSGASAAGAAFRGRQVAASLD